MMPPSQADADVQAALAAGHLSNEQVAALVAVAAVAYWIVTYGPTRRLAARLVALVGGLAFVLVLFVAWTLASLIANRLGGGLQL